jgi:hypothetical protein
MRIVGYRFRDHLRLLMPLFGLLTAVWLARWILGGLGVPHWTLRVVSMTVASAVCVMLAAVLIHVRRFGSYTNVVVSSLLINVWSELLIILAILFSVGTGIENVFTAPEYSIKGDDALHLRHIYGHLTFGIGLGTFSGSAVGTLLLWLLRLLVPLPIDERSSR